MLVVSAVVQIALVLCHLHTSLAIYQGVLQSSNRGGLMITVPSAILSAILFIVFAALRAMTFDSLRIGFAYDL